MAKESTSTRMQRLGSDILSHKNILAVCDAKNTFAWAVQNYL